MHVHCSREQAKFNFAYTFSVDIETLLLMKCVNRGRNIIEQYLIIWNLNESRFGDVVYTMKIYLQRVQKIILYMYVKLQRIGYNKR